MEASNRADDFVPAGLASLGIEADEVDLAVMGAAHQMFWPAIRELLALDTSGVEPERCPDLSKAPETAVSALDLPLRDQAAAIAAGEVDPAELLEATLARIEERNPAVNAVVETFPERSREMLAAAPDGPLRGVPVVIKDEWPLPWRAQRFGAAEMLAADRAGRVRPLPRPARRRRGDRRRRQHARARAPAAPATPPSTGRPATPGTPSAARAAPPAAPPPRSRRASSPARSAPTGSARSASPPPTAG